MSVTGLIGRKLGMTTHYDDDGSVEPLTAVELGPCVVTQVKTMARDGYEAVQLGFMTVKNINKPQSGHLIRSGGKYRYLREVNTEDLSSVEVGQEIKLNVFEVGQKIKVIGISKGKGFSGTVKRYNFKGGPKTHGQSDRHRAPGSIGAGSSPGRVWKGTRMAGHQGVDRVTTRGLKIIKVDNEQNVLFVRGSIPGPVNGIVMVEKQT